MSPFSPHSTLLYAALYGSTGFESRKSLILLAPSPGFEPEGRGFRSAKGRLDIASFAGSRIPPGVPFESSSLLARWVGFGWPQASGRSARWYRCIPVMHFSAESSLRQRTPALSGEPLCPPLFILTRTWPRVYHGPLKLLSTPCVWIVRFDNRERDTVVILLLLIQATSTMNTRRGKWRNEPERLQG